MARIDALPSITSEQIVASSDTLIIDTTTGTKKITMQELLNFISSNIGSTDVTESNLD